MVGQLRWRVRHKLQPPQEGGGGCFSILLELVRCIRRRHGVGAQLTTPTASVRGPDAAFTAVEAERRWAADLRCGVRDRWRGGLAVLL